MRAQSRATVTAVLLLAALLVGGAMPAAADSPNDAPPNPTNVRASDGTYDDKIEVTWHPVTGADFYRVFRAKDAMDGAKISIANTTNLYLADVTEPRPLQICYYWVKACTGTPAASVCSSGFGDPDSGYKGLATPVVSASDGAFTGGVRITWSSVPYATSYTLYRGVSEHGYTIAVPGITATSYDDLSAAAGVIYYYWVEAVASLDTTWSLPDTGYRNFYAPQNVTASDGTYTDKVRVAWSAVGGATRYQVWREPAAGGAAQKIGVSAVTTFDDAAAVPGDAYDYFVKACNSAETICSQSSSQDGGHRAPAAPTGVQASDGIYADRVRVTWNSVASISYYSVLRASSPTGPMTQIATWTGTAYDDMTAAAGATYFYWVKACGADHCGAASVGDSGCRGSAATPTPTRTRTATPTPTRTATVGPTPTRTATPPAGARLRTYLPMLLNR